MSIVPLVQKEVNSSFHPLVNGFSGYICREEIAVPALFDVLPDGLDERCLLVCFRCVLESDVSGVGFGVIGDIVSPLGRPGHIAVNNFSVWLLQFEENAQGLPYILFRSDIHDRFYESIEVPNPDFVVNAACVVALAEQLAPHLLHLYQRRVVQYGSRQFPVAFLLADACFGALCARTDNADCGAQADAPE